MKHQICALEIKEDFQIPKDMGLVDTGCTENFMQPGAHVKNVRPKKIITITQPDGAKLR